jgi:hypothetical protein
MPKLPWKPWHEVVRLREDLESGALPLHMFAADLYGVLMQSGKRPVYEDPEQFFTLAFPTYNLRQLVRDEANASDLPAWLRREVLPQDPDEAHVQDYALAWHREGRIEPSPPYSLSSSGGANSGDLKTVLAMCMKARAGSTPI